MKANEFRIGNYYDEFGNIHQVSWSSIKTLSNGIPSQIWCKPIPLTEEWLIKLGFELRINPIKNVNFNNFWLPNNYAVCHCVRYLSDKIHEYDKFYCGQTDIKIEYVHQLQNLYFALTGNELTIK